MMSDAEKVSDILARLQAVDRMVLPQRIHDFANASAAELTPECIEPYELAEVGRFHELPPARQKHVLSCTLCALVVGVERTGTPGIAASENVAATAAVARTAARRPWTIAAIVAAIAVGIATVFATGVKLFDRLSLRVVARR